MLTSGQQLPPVGTLSILPSILVSPAPGGVTVADTRPTPNWFLIVATAFIVMWNLSSFGTLCFTLAIAAITITAFAATGPAAIAPADFLSFRTLGGLLGIGSLLLFPALGIVGLIWLRRKWRLARRTTPATLLVSAWPVRFNQRVSICFQRGLANLAVQQVTATLRCQEVVRYSVGSSTHEARHDVLNAPLTLSGVTVQPDGVRFTADVQLPVVGPSSFQGHSNRIEWAILVTLGAPNFPLVESTFPLLLLPEVLP